MSIDVIIENMYGTFSTAIFLVEKDMDGHVQAVMDPISTHWSDYKEGQLKPRPTIELCSTADEAIVAKFTAAAIDSHLVKAPEKQNDGELSATKLHLKDMQRLVFDKEEVINVSTSSFIPRDSWRPEDPSMIHADRIREAAKRCPQASATLKILFPEVFNNDHVENT